MDATVLSSQKPLVLRAAILSAASVAGKKEAEGPLGNRFDLTDPANRFGKKTWEDAESEMQRTALNAALGKAKMRDRDLGALFGGDLLNQCVGSAYGLLSFDVPYFGLYGACSTSAEGILLASIGVTGGFFNACGIVTSSHYCAAERQYRTPLEYGAQRPPTAQWTVTGAGAFLVTADGNADRAGETENTTDPAAGESAAGTSGGELSGGKKTSPLARVTRGMPGKAIEKGIRDANNMGAAMAPAAQETLVRFFRATGERPENYDRIVTGDLGYEGGAILCDLLTASGYPMGERYADCGQLIYHRAAQDVHSGGSGCGCSATVLAAYFLPMLARGEIGRMLFLATGAMMSPDSVKQGKSIPAVAHLLELESPLGAGETEEK